MLESTNLLEWLKLLGGILLFLGPGFCIVSILYNHSLKGLTHWFVLSLTASVSLLGVLLAWLKLANLHINLPILLSICLAGWIASFIYLWRNKRQIEFKKYSINIHEIVLWIVSLGSGLIVLWLLGHQVAGLGSDSYHHTLIAQLIHDNGGLPNDYQPATDRLISFSYHYGYHAMIAALMWLSGWGSRLLVLVSGALLVMFTTLSIALLTEEITEKPIAGIAAGILTGLVFVLPIHMLQWGRYPQMSAIALIAVFLEGIIAYYKHRDRPIDLRKIALFGLIAAGIALTHYRVTIMAALAVVFLVLLIKDRKYSIKSNYQLLLSMLATAGIALFLFSPWLWRVVQAHQTGYAITLADINPAYYSIFRLDPNVLNYPTNLLVVVIIGAGLIWGMIKQKWFIFWLSVWPIAMLLLSDPRIFSLSMDRISVIVSLYLPAAVLGGWLIQEVYMHIKNVYHPILTAALLVPIIWSGTVAVNKNLVLSNFVTPQDLAAAEWIKANTPSDAYFAVNTFKFDFSSNFVIGIDAGYWLPLLANRSTVTIPMIYEIEMFQRPDGLQQLMELYNLGSDLTTQKAIDYLQQEKITYIYIGENGGRIDPNLLLKSTEFSLVYQKDKVYVFKINTQ